MNKVFNRVNLGLCTIGQTKDEMTQRNNMQPTDILKGADAYVATATEQSTFTAATSAHAMPPAHRTRRGARIAVSLTVSVRDQFHDREETRTQFVMARGAILGTKSNFHVGHKLTIQNVKSGRSAECQVIAAEPAPKGIHNVEVEFIRPEPDFWPVQFPEDDSKAGTSHVSPSTLAVEATTSSHMTVENSPTSARHHGHVVSLADAITQDYIPAPALPAQDKFTSRSAPIDSVAQFRAANRAAHRRQQRKRALFSLAIIALVAALIVGARFWMEHKPEGFHVSMPSLPQSSTSATTNEVALAPEPAPSPAKSSPTPIASTQTQTSSRDVPRSSGNTPITIILEEPALIPIEAKSVETQVAVRHGSSAPGLPRRTDTADAGEAPQALPLRVGEDSTSEQEPPVLNDVVAQAPTSTAVLQAQPASRPVPARLSYSVPAQYPSMARQMRVEGDVVLSVAVDDHGNVSSAKAVSGPPVLRAAAVESVRRWKYQPATLGDKPVASTE